MSLCCCCASPSYISWPSGRSSDWCALHSRLPAVCVASLPGVMCISDAGTGRRANHHPHLPAALHCAGGGSIGGPYLRGHSRTSCLPGAGALVQPLSTRPEEALCRIQIQQYRITPLDKALRGRCHAQAASAIYERSCGLPLFIQEMAVHLRQA